jgi:hypothetical protein
VVAAVISYVAVFVAATVHALSALKPTALGKILLFVIIAAASGIDPVYGQELVLPPPDVPTSREKSVAKADAGFDLAVTPPPLVPYRWPCGKIL